MAKCPNCEFDITTNGCNTEEIVVPNGTAYLLSCKKCDKILGIVSEPKWRLYKVACFSGAKKSHFFNMGFYIYIFYNHITPLGYILKSLKPIS